MYDTKYDPRTGQEYLVDDAEQPRTIPDTPYANAVLGMRERRAAERAIGTRAEKHPFEALPSDSGTCRWCLNKPSSDLHANVPQSAPRTEQPASAAGSERDDDECAFVHRLVSGNVRCGALRQHHSQYTGHEFVEPQPPAPAAQETETCVCSIQDGKPHQRTDYCDDLPSQEWRYVETFGTGEVVISDLTLRPHWTGLKDADEIRAILRQVVRDHNSHRALSAERARLRAALQEIQSYRDTCLICISDEEDTELDTEYRKGARAVLDNVAAMASRALNEQGKESG